MPLCSMWRGLPIVVASLTRISMTSSAVLRVERANILLKKGVSIKSIGCASGNYPLPLTQFDFPESPWQAKTKEWCYFKVHSKIIQNMKDKMRKVS